MKFTIGLGYYTLLLTSSGIGYAAQEPIINQASVEDVYQSAVSLASSNFEAVKRVISDSIGTATPKPIHEEMLSSATSAYSGALAAASSRLNAAIAVGEGYASTISASAASAMGSQGTMESISSVASSNLAAALSIANEQYNSAKTAVGATPTPAAQKFLDDSRKRYYEAVGYAHEQYGDFVGSASKAIYGPEKGSLESVTSVVADTAASATAAVADAAETVAAVAQEKWELLVKEASSRIYGTPTPIYEAYASQITESAQVQYQALAAYIQELVQGKEPDFTDSALSRLSSVYYDVTGQASSVANEALSSASSVAAVISSYFAPPEATAALDTFTAQLESVVAAASAQVYGTQPGVYEKATSAVDDAYSKASSVASAAVYGTETPYLEAASSGIEDAFNQAQAAVSAAIYGTQTGKIESASSAAADAYETAASYISDSLSQANDAAASVAEQVQNRVSAAIYGPEVTQGAIESINSRMSVAVASAQKEIEKFASEAGKNAEVVASAVSKSVESAASAASSVVKSVKDEL